MLISATPRDLRSRENSAVPAIQERLREPGPLRAAVVLLFAGVLLGASLPFLPEPVSEQLYGWSSLVFPAMPILWSWRLLRHEDLRTRRAWRWIFAGVMGLFAYEVLWLVRWLFELDTLWDNEDAISVIVSPLIVIGSLRGLRRPRDRTDGARTLLDALIVFLSLSTAIITVLAAAGALPTISSARDLINIVDPLAGVFTIGGLAVLWVRRDYSAVPPWALWIGWSLLAGMVSDIYYATPYGATHPSPWFVRIAWYVSWTMLGIASAMALQQRDTPIRTRAPQSRLPYVMVLVCYASLILVVVQDNHGLMTRVTIAVGLVTLLVLARQVLVGRELEALYRERATLHAENRLAALVKHGSDLLSVIDPDGTVRFASPSHEATIGYTPDFLTGRNLFDGIHRDDVDRVRHAFAELTAGRGWPGTVTFRLRHIDRSWRWIDGFAADLRKEPGIRALVLNGRDVTERQAMEAQLLDQALRDPLTGLANRRLFRDRVEHALARVERGAAPIAVLFLDLDHFKLVNDTLGHAAGDTLLTTVAGRLVAALRASDTIARLGGDEFAVLIEDMADTRDADLAAQRIQQTLERPIRLDDRDVYVGASIGIAQALCTQNVDDLLADADAAMYAAKQAGRGRILGYTSAMRDSARERMEIEGELRHALKHGQLRLAYQPVLELREKRISGAEALMRWDHPTRGPIPPSRFIPVAEESDLIIELGRVALHQAARDIVWLRQTTTRATHLTIAVNLSPRHLLHPDVVEHIEEALHAAGAPASSLVIEITETVLAANEAIIAERLQLLRELGVQIALDDFGTGYSSLAYLRRFPIDILKIDRSFLADHEADITHDGVTRAIISIGQSLNLRTVAEGVETERQLHQLERMGCTHAQGFIIARPADRDALATMLTTMHGGRGSDAGTAHQSAA